MRVLAADPGYDRLGVAVVERQSGTDVLVHSDCITSPKDLSLPERLIMVGEQFEELLKTHSPTAVALETIYFNKNQKTAIAVSEARGVLLYLAKKHGCTVFEYTPQQIKVAITGYGKSDKEQVTLMVKRLVPTVRDGALDDEYDAIATGLTCLASERMH